MNVVTAQIFNRLMTVPDFLSGESLCHEFSITRSAVWKHIGLLRSEGYQIDAVTGRGYRLSGMTGRPVEAEVLPFLTGNRFGRKIIYHPLTASTNILAKAMAVSVASITLNPLIVTVSFPILPAILFPLKTRPGVVDIPIDPGALCLSD